MARRFVIDPNIFPDLPTLMLVSIEALNAVGGSATIQELDEKIIELEGVTETEQGVLMPNGRDQRLHYYLAWARTYLKRGDALFNSARGVWALTEVGEQITKIEQTIKIYDQVNEEEKIRAKEKRLKAKNDLLAVSASKIPMIHVDEDSESPDGWKNKLLDRIMQITPQAFERLSQRLLREAGFVKVEVRGKTGDGGIDGVGVLRLNLVSFQIYFQCKKWKGSVGSKEIRDFRGAVQGRADKGLFITTGNFTSQASEEATRDGAIAIDLIDGERLCELLKQFELGVVTKTVEVVEIQDKWFDGI